MRSTLWLCSTFTMALVMLTASVALAQGADSVPEPATEPAPVSEPVAAPVSAAVVQEPTARLTFGMAGQFVVSAERLFGVTWESMSSEENGTKRSYSTTSVELLSNRLGGALGNYGFSRLAGDYFVVDGFSVGAALGYFHVSGHSKQETDGVTEEQDTGSTSGFIVAPRVGFATMLSPIVGLWPKAGITYITMSGEDADGNDEGSASRTAFSLEAPLVITPVSHAGFSIGPTLDYGIAGSNDNTSIDVNTGATSTESVDVSTMAIGLHAGLFLYF